MPAPDRVNLPVGLFPGAGVALTPQEKEALDRQEFLAYQRQRREEAVAEREGSANRLRNGVFDFMENTVGASPEWANRAAGAIDYIPVLGDASGGEDVWQDVKAGNWKNAAIGTVATGIGVVPMVGDVASKGLRTIARGADDVAAPAVRLLADDAAAAIGHNGGPRLNDDLDLGLDVLGARARQLEIKDLSKRTQPSPDMLQVDTTPEGYERNLGRSGQETIATPERLPFEQPYPKRDRVRPFIDRQEEIAQHLAEQMRPHMGGAKQYFYHTGPLLEAAEKAGMSPAEAKQMFEEFAGYYAATSPRTKTEDNLRSATLARWKHKLGIPLTDTVGPVKTTMVKDKATGKMVEKELLGEKGYPMMIGEARPGQAEGVHRARLEELRTGVGLNMLQNTKPYTFEKNVAGNLQGATIDTHAIRGAVKALNDMDPGSVPPTWLEPKYRQQYAEDPGSLDVATMIDDKLEVDDVLGQTEYGPLSDLYGRAGEILGVPPAVAQSLGWFGSGVDTGLGSQAKTVAELFDERVAVTAKELNMKPQEVLVKALRGQMPLLSIGGIGAIPLINQMTKDDEARAKKQPSAGRGGA